MVEVNDFHRLTEFLADGAKHATMLSGDSIDWGSNQLKKRIATLVEPLTREHISFAFDANHYIFEAFNTKVVQLVESGLARKFIDDDELFVKEFKATSAGPKVITMDHLEFGFQIWLFLLAVAALVFLLECAYRFLSVKLLKIIKSK